MRSLSRPPSRLVRVSAIFWLSLLAASTASAQQPVPRATQPDPLVRMNESIDALTKKVWPSVVQIVVSSYGPQREGPVEWPVAQAAGRTRSMPPEVTARGWRSLARVVTADETKISWAAPQTDRML